MPAPSTITNVVIGIATIGRAPILAEMLFHLRQQTWQNLRIIICHPTSEDVAGIDLTGIESIEGPRGLTCQRNAILDRCKTEDLIIFFDDDFFAEPTYIDTFVKTFSEDASIAAADGKVLADGAKSPGLIPEDAYKILAPLTPHPSSIIPAFNTYGCNMAFRLSTVRQNHLRFDEKLPLYGWYEDMDFSRTVGHYGRIVRILSARGVHLGAKSGKTAGKRLGYSQVSNSIYLARKGTYPWDHALKSAGRHILINLIRSLRPEPYVDRRGRVAGNFLALADILRGRITPGRIVTL